ncbi:MAG: hypothetical protein JWO35_25 [Candidatus Saccharibacteria bacterium]|nr:hypothetical protein [Candidatus Saccharibacteria bacterium]
MVSTPEPSTPEPVLAAPAPLPNLPESERFAPPKPVRKRRKLPKLPRFPKFRKPVISGRAIKIILIILAVSVVLGGLYALMRYQAYRNNPDTVFKDALQASLSTTKFQSETMPDTTSSKVSYDLSAPTNPMVSSEATIQLSGTSYDVNGYGTAKNTYVSYRSLPKTVSPSLSSVVQNAWVGVRINGALPAGVPTALAGAGDPRNLAYGPVFFANIAPKIRKQQVQYMIAKKVYDYKVEKVTQTKIGDTKVFVFAAQPNVSYLKIANQSAAFSAGLTPADIQDAVNALDNLKGATMKLYIAKSNHQLVRTEITKDNRTVSTTYSYDSNLALPTEPQTKLGWPDFASYQFQIEAQAATKQPAAQLDSTRKAQLDSLHSYLATYFAQNESYPSLANVNDQAWVAGNLNGIDPDVMRDPLASSLTLLAAPKAAVLAYQPLPPSGKGACDNTVANPCVHYKLIATLSNNQQYIVQDP